MLSDIQREKLEKPFGYELATLVMDQSMTRSEIRSQMPYDNFNHTQLQRIIDEMYEVDLLEVVGGRGPNKFRFNTSELSYIKYETISEKKKIREKAATRCMNPSEAHDPIEWDGLPSTFTSNLDKENMHVDDHQDSAFSESKWKRNDTRT